MSETGPAGEQRPSVGGYLIGAVLLVAIVGGIWLAISSGGDEAEGGAAHISTASGSTNGLTPDDRVGTGGNGPTGSDGSGGGSPASLARAAARAGCELREGLAEEGRDHLTRDDPVPGYATDPPTSGNHIGPPLQQADGAWLDPAAPVDVVHSLEHGRIAIQYSPDLPERDQLALKGLYDTAYSAALLFPNPEMEWQVAATAWRNLIGCDRYRGQATLDAIRAFGAAHQGRGPEAMDGFPALKGPSFINP